MQAHSRHKSLDVLTGYVTARELFEDHAGEALLRRDSKAIKKKMSRSGYSLVKPRYMARDISGIAARARAR